MEKMILSKVGLTPSKLATFRYAASVRHLQLVEDDKNIYAIHPYEIVRDGQIIDNSEAYNREQKEAATRQYIASLEKQLADGDYKITKCYEASLIGVELPYDIKALHEERQAIRDKINEKKGQIR